MQNIVFESSRQPDKVLHCTGHHGVNFEGHDNLYTGFDYRTRFVHDIHAAQLARRLASK